MKKNVLIISPHADDEILGCGGFISKYSKKNYYINVLILTNANKGAPEIYSTEEIKNIRIPVSEQLKYSSDVMKLNIYLKELLNLIKNNTDKNNILLSCYDGKSVSALVCALYIIKNSSITKETVRQLIQSKCKDISLDYELSVFDINGV